MNESVVTVNLQINDKTNEIECIKMESADISCSDGDDYETEGEQIDEENVLVPKGDGVMTIKSKKKTILEHVCAKCSSSYRTLVGLKRHLNLCRNTPKDHPVQLKQETALVDIDFSSVDEDTCFCCLEPKDSAHVGHVKCNFCPKSFKSHLNLERHLYTIHSANTSFPCKSCNATCPSKLVLDLHMLSHSTGKPYSCQVCGRDFTRKYHLDRHKKFSKCSSSSTASSAPKNKSNLTCQVCSRVFTRIDNLREHLRGHMGQPTRRKDYQCPYCDKSFYGSSLLNIHIRTHTGEKPFVCDLCQKSFPSNGALRKHRRMHTGEKPYSCGECQKSFAAKETLNRHTKIHTGVRPHVCNVCGKEFIQSTQLRSHMLKHTGENGHHCSICEQVFNRKSGLQKHIKEVHDGAQIDEKSLDDPEASKKSKTKATHKLDVDNDENLVVSEYHITYQDESNLQATIVLKQEKV
ncbi:Protein suppressor of hairy wing, partial [Pseudolycoriella hygida]